MLQPFYIPYNISDHEKPIVLIQTLNTHAFSAVAVDYGDERGVQFYARDFSVIDYVYSDTGTFTLRLSGFYQGGTTVQVATIRIYDNFDPYDTTTFFDYISATTNNYKLPYSRTQLVQSNDWVTADNINAAFAALQGNLNYLENLCHRPDLRGDETILAWLGTDEIKWINIDYALIGSNTNDFIATGNNELVEISTTDTNYLSATGFGSIVDIAVKDDNEVGNKLYLIDGTSVAILSSDYNATVMLSTSNIQFNKTFNTPNSIDVDSIENIYIADPGNNEVYKFRYSNNQLVLQTSVGGLGTAGDKYRLNTPNQVRIDSQDRVIISDRDNYAIKIYDSLMTWINTISADQSQGKILALAINLKDDTIYTVTDQKYLQRYSKTGTLLGSTQIPQVSPNIVQCFIEYSGNYIYIVCTGTIYKYTLEGLFLKTMSVPLNDSQSGNLVTSGRSDNHNQTFIASRTKVFRIDSTPPFINIKPFTTELYYSLDDFKIQGKEGVEDWVYNKALSRLIHNHIVFARNVYATFVRGVTTSNQLQYFVVGTRDFDEILTFEISDDLYIGMNEPVLVGVINRALGKLYDFQVKALEYISPQIQTVYNVIPTL